MPSASAPYHLARLLLLREWQAQGKLDGMTQTEIGQLFTPPVSKQLIGRDLRDLPRLEQAIQAIQKQPLE